MTFEHISYCIKEKNKFCFLKLENYIKGQKIMTFTDPEFGDFQAIVYKVIYSTKEHPKRTSLKKKKLKYTADYVYNEVKKLFPYLTLVKESFKGMDSNALFIDDIHGEYSTRPYNVLKGHTNKQRGILKRKSTMVEMYGVEFFSQHKDFKNKITNTYMSRYGVSHNMKCPKLALKNARSQNKYIETSHWKTNEIIGCIGSYEKATVDYLNKNNINYKWQPIVIDLGDTTYRPDLYLEDLDLWIEIKGYFRKDALDKWNRFKLLYPNSELWDEKYLKENGIL